MIGQTISHYKILEKLGEGGMGVVYKAHDTKLDRIIALKFLPHYLTTDVTEKERFYHEARAASALMHPNVAIIFEVNEYESQIYLAMEFVEGKTLKKLIEEDTLSIKKVLDIAIQSSDGLASAHEKGVVHRDIKSDNIMITPKGQVKIMDFGLAKVKGATKLTKAGSTIGTAAYMSPEQAQGEEVDHRSDIFSFGVVLYELLTTKLPFRGEHQAALMYSLINEEPQPIARFNEKITPELERIASKTLAKDREDRYQHIDELLADLRRERKQLEYARAGYASMSSVAAAAPVVPPKKKSILRYVIPASSLVVVVLLLVIVNPFNFQISTQKSAAAPDQNSIAVMYFENVADPQDQDKTAKMLTSLLITGLSESKSFRVMSTQRLYDILKQLGKEDLKAIDKGVASDVAKKAGVNLVVTGELLQVKPNIVLTVEVSEVDGGKILIAEKIEGTPEQNVFSVVDKLSGNIRKSLLSSEQAESEPGKAVADITTHSPEAYRYYLEAIELGNKFYNSEARVSFKKAIEIDSMFAMAYFRLAGNEPSLQLKRNYYRKAFRDIDRVTMQERDLIGLGDWLLSDSSTFDLKKGIQKAQEYLAKYPDDKEIHYSLGEGYFSKGEFQKSIQELTKTIELDPLYKLAYNALAYAYDDVGDVDKSLWAINKYISIAPDEANPYDTRGDLYAKHGKLNEAIDSYKKALSIKPDFPETPVKLRQLFIYAREFTKVDSCVRILKASDDKNARFAGKSLSIEFSLYRGRFQLALAETDNLLIPGEKEPPVGWQLTYHIYRWRIFLMMKNYPDAISEAKQVIRHYKRNNMDALVYPRHSYVILLAESGDLKRAEKIAEEVRRDIERNDTSQISAYWLAVGWIERMKANLAASLSAFKKSVVNSDRFGRHFMLGRTYLDLNMLGEAVSEFEKQELNYSDDERLSLWGAQLHYYLGIAYEKSGWTQKAITQYEEFLDILKNADKGISEVEDAKQRLEKLKKKA